MSKAKTQLLHKTFLFNINIYLLYFESKLREGIFIIRSLSPNGIVPKHNYFPLVNFQNLEFPGMSAWSQALEQSHCLHVVKPRTWGIQYKPQFFILPTKNTLKETESEREQEEKEKEKKNISREEETGEEKNPKVGMSWVSSV